MAPFLGGWEVDAFIKGAVCRYIYTHIHRRTIFLKPSCGAQDFRRIIGE